MLKRTHTCGQLRLSDAGKKVTLAGWVRSYRDHGNLVFIDVRDREGLTQLVFNPETQPQVHKLARTLRCEWVVAAKGIVQPRSEGMDNPKLPTGQIEVSAEQCNASCTYATASLRLPATISTGWASGRSKRQCWQRARLKVQEISSCPADSTRTASTPCRSHHSSSSRF